MTRLRSLSGAAAFRRVFTEGVRARRDGLQVAIAPTPEGSGLRVGLTVGRKVGGAVTRNRIKRRLRAAIDEAGLRGDKDVVIRADKEVSSKKYAELRADLAAALRAATGGSR